MPAVARPDARARACAHDPTDERASQRSAHDASRGPTRALDDAFARVATTRCLDSRPTERLTDRRRARRRRARSAARDSARVSLPRLSRVRAVRPTMRGVRCVRCVGDETIDARRTSGVGVRRVRRARRRGRRAAQRRRTRTVRSRGRDLGGGDDDSSGVVARARAHGETRGGDATRARTPRVDDGTRRTRRWHRRPGAWIGREATIDLDTDR